MADEEPNLGGKGMGGGPSVSIGGNISFPGVDKSADSLTKLHKALKDVETVLDDISKKKETYAAAFTKITSAASGMAKGVGGATSGGSGTSTSQTYANASQLSDSKGVVNTGANRLAGAISDFAGGSSVGTAIGNNFAGKGDSPGSSLDSLGGFGKAIGSLSSAKDLGGLVTGLMNIMNVPIAYAHDRTEDNREAARRMASTLGPAGTLSGKTIENLIATLGGKIPVYGNVGQITEALATGSKAGYTLAEDPTSQARSGAFYANIRQQQAFAPGMSSSDLAKANVGVLNNTGMQQRSMLLTGGAFSSFGPGGVPKTLQEWAESILKFFENQRPGRDRGKPFSKEELQTQMFPGSNMNAWFSTIGLSGGQQYMVDFFWQYAIGKANITGGSSGEASIDDIAGYGGGDFLGSNTWQNLTDSTFRARGGAGVKGEDLASFSLMRTTAQARRDFDLTAMGPGAMGWLSKLGSGGATALTGTNNSMYRQYVRRERSDRTFENFMNQADKALIGRFQETMGGVWGNTPTPIAEMLYQLEQNVAPSVAGNLAELAAKVAMATGSGGASAAVGDVPVYGKKKAKVGDVGQWGPYGGTGFIGMDLGFAGRLQEMMADNPNITITSGYRDGATQERLHAAGVGQVAPAGQSYHSKGTAADLGPEDQLGWIAANAHKYGLQSAAHLGEPWHVGFPGTVPIGDPTSSMFGMLGTGISDAMGGNLGSLFGKNSPFDIASSGKSAFGGLKDLFGIPDFASGGSAADISKMFGGLLGSGIGAGGLGGLAVRGVSSLLGGLAGLVGSAASGIANAVGGGGGASNSADLARIFQTYNAGKSAAGSDLGAADAQRALEALRVAKAAGFSGDSLVLMGAIAGRESGWKPQKHSDPRLKKDDSFGLWQINMKPSPGYDPARARKDFGITKNEELYDAATNARAAWVRSGQGKNFKPWAPGDGKGNRLPILTGAAQFVEPIYNLAKQNNLIGDPRSLVSSRGGGAAMGGVTNNVTTNITVGGGGMKEPEARRVGSVIADTIEAEMKSRLSRTY